MDFADIKGQEAVKRAILIAMAGNHSILLVGPSGNGKTMLFEAAGDLSRNRNVGMPIVNSVTLTDDDEAFASRCANFVHFDIHIEVPRVPFCDLTDKRPGTSTERMLKILTGCAKHADLSLSDSCLLILKQAYDEMGLSPRGFNAIVRVARTIANLDGSEKIQELHVAEAAQYRLIDRHH